MTTRIDIETWDRTRDGLHGLHSQAKSLAIRWIIGCSILVSAVGFLNFPSLDSPLVAILWSALAVLALGWCTFQWQIRRKKDDIVRPIVDELVPAVVQAAPADRVVRLVLFGAVLIGKTMVRAELHANGYALISTTSIDDVPDEFKGGPSLWFRGWAGGEPQGW